MVVEVLKMSCEITEDVSYLLESQGIVTITQGTSK